MSNRLRRFIFLLIAFIAGAILPLAFAPINAYFIAFISPAILLYLWQQTSSKGAFWTGFSFGLGLFGVGASWIYVSIHRFGNANIALASFITLLFIIILSLFSATQGYCFQRVAIKKRPALTALLIFPFIWFVWEWLRSWLFSGFPWLFLGYSQVHSSLKGFAPLFGVYGLSIIVTLISGFIILITLKKRSIKILSVILILLFFILGNLFSKIQWTHPNGPERSVTLVQGNIPQTIKWDNNYLLHILTVYKNETESHWSSPIIIWPEGAIPAYPEQLKSYFESLQTQAKQHHTSLILGVPIYNPERQESYNGMLILGNQPGMYLKRRLVPFGEYIPLKHFFGRAMQFLNIPMSDLSRGPKKQPTVFADHIPFAPFICYEIAYPHSAIKTIESKELIIVINDDSWFGDSIAPAQQLQIAQMRALETGRYLLFISNTGITAIINPKGEIQQKIPTNIQATLTGKITPMRGKTLLMYLNL